LRSWPRQAEPAMLPGRICGAGLFCQQVI